MLRRPEGKTLEFKRDLSSPDGVLRSIVAFANTAGGILVVGVEDVTRDVRGVGDPLAEEERLANLVSDSIQPRLVPDIEVLPWRHTHVLAIRVYPSAARPHFLRREGRESGSYVRVGSTNRRADDALIAEMSRFARGESFDEQPMTELSSEAIDFRAASESFAAVRTLREVDLETPRLVTRHQGREVPTVGGVLLFGTAREQCFPDAWIQAGRFGGVDRTTIVDQASIRGHLPNAVESAIAFTVKHAMRGAEIGPVRRIDRWNIPLIAVREAIINAVVHADYAQRGAPIRVSIFDDRLEIENPGLLLFGLTLDDLNRGVSKLRNRVIGRVFHELGLIEQWGSGIQRMRTACLEAGLPPPSIEEVGTRFRVTLHLTAVAAPIIDDVDRIILDLLAGDDGAPTRDIAQAIGLSTRATRARLAGLVRRGLVRHVSSGLRDPRRRYVPTL